MKIKDFIEFFMTHDEGIVDIGNRDLSMVEEANGWVAFSYVPVFGTNYVVVMKRRPEKERNFMVKMAKKTIATLKSVEPMKLYPII